MTRLAGDTLVKNMVEAAANKSVHKNSQGMGLGDLIVGIAEIDKNFAELASKYGLNADMADEYRENEKDYVDNDILGYPVKMSVNCSAVVNFTKRALAVNDIEDEDQFKDAMLVLISAVVCKSDNQTEAMFKSRSIEGIDMVREYAKKIDVSLTDEKLQRTTSEIAKVVECIRLLTDGKDLPDIVSIGDVREKEKESAYGLDYFLKTVEGKEYLGVQSDRVFKLVDDMCSTFLSPRYKVMVLIGDEEYDVADLVYSAWRQLAAENDYDKKGVKLVKFDYLHINQVRDHADVYRLGDELVKYLCATGSVVLVDNLEKLLAGSTQPYSNSAVLGSIEEQVLKGELCVIFAVNKTVYNKYKNTKLFKIANVLDVDGPNKDELYDELLTRLNNESYLHFSSAFRNREKLHDWINYMVAKIAEVQGSNITMDFAGKVLDQSIVYATSITNFKVSYRLNKVDIDGAVESLTGIHLSTSESQRNTIKNLDTTLNSKVIGQEEAVKAVSKAIKRNSCGIRNVNRPMATFMFVGPTGVGKTYLCKCLAETMFNNDGHLDMIKLDMGEYSESHTVSKLFGAPPGYVGYEEGGQLTEWAKEHPYGLVILDEIEKAHPNIYNGLLQLLDDGVMTGGNGERVSFKNHIIVMTSNAGYGADIKEPVGFITKKDTTSLIGMDARERKAMEALSYTFKPEFLNRIDSIVVFNSLDREQAVKIVKLRLNEIKDRLKTRGYNVRFSNKLVNELSTAGFSEKYGARNLNRAVQNIVEDGLAEFILDGKLEENPEKPIWVTMDDGNLRLGAKG